MNVVKDLSALFYKFQITLFFTSEDSFNSTALTFIAIFSC